MDDEWVVNFPTLGYLASDWIEAHCVVPDGFDLGKPFRLEGWQLWSAAKHYQVVPKTEFRPDRPILAPAFQHRRSQIVGPQKLGKDPFAAAVVAFEAVGPCLFGGWANGREVFRCEDDGCGCGFEFAYEPGEPMGLMRPTTLFQMLATSQDQVDNTYRPLQAMVNRGPLAERISVREGFMRLPNEGRIDTVTAAANSKLGAPINGAVMTETGLYTKQSRLLKVAQTMSRNLAGMGGRAIGLTNAWDPMEDSYAQRTHASHRPDIFEFYRQPPVNLSYKNKRERHKIHQYVYAGAPWVDLDAIEAEAAELLETDPAQAERFFGNRLVQGLGAYMAAELWEASKAPAPSTETRIGLGFDGSRSGDWSAIRCETVDGYRFTPTYGPDKRPAYWDPAEWPDGRIPRGEVDSAMQEIFAKFQVARAYIDPRHWETQADQWATMYGEDVVVLWPTNQIARMFEALSRFIEDTAECITTHDDDPTVTLHALAARKVAKPGDKYILGKPSENQKIDLLMADILAHEAVADARADGSLEPKDTRVTVFR